MDNMVNEELLHKSKYKAKIFNLRLFGLFWDDAAFIASVIYNLIITLIFSTLILLNK